MEKLITPSIIILFSVATASANSVIAEHESLMHDLFASYSVFSGPYHSNKPLLIGFHLTPIYIDVTEDGFIEGEFWYNLAWNDFRLRWDEEARNIRDLHISKEIIWTPDIVPLSRDVVETIDDRRSAILDYKGEIIFFPRVFLRGRCNGVDLWNPWKEFNCSLKYGSWSHTKEYLDFTNIVQSEPIFFNDLSNPVNVIRISVSKEYENRNNDDKIYAVINIKLTLKRNRLIYSKSIIPNPHTTPSTWSKAYDTIKSYSFGIL